MEQAQGYRTKFWWLPWFSAKGKVHPTNDGAHFFLPIFTAAKDEKYFNNVPRFLAFFDLPTYLPKSHFVPFRKSCPFYDFPFCMTYLPTYLPKKGTSLMDVPKSLVYIKLWETLAKCRFLSKISSFCFVFANEQICKWNMLRNEMCFYLWLKSS